MFPRFLIKTVTHMKAIFCLIVVCVTVVSYTSCSSKEHADVQVVTVNISKSADFTYRSEVFSALVFSFLFISVKNYTIKCIIQS